MHLVHIVQGLPIGRNPTILIDSGTAGVISGDSCRYAICTKPAEVIELDAQIDRTAENVAERAYGFTPIPAAVAGISCMRPIAPAGLPASI